MHDAKQNLQTSLSQVELQSTLLGRKGIERLILPHVGDATFEQIA
jgi:hypothetical protein